MVTQDSNTAAGLCVPLTTYHLRFTVRAETPILFGEFKGSALRGAFATALRHTFCPEWRADTVDPLHRALCPICRLLAAENDDTQAGDIRRPYAMQPPLLPKRQFEPGESFAFGITLFGSGLHTLPFVVSVTGGMGEMGVGLLTPNGQRGRFMVERIDATFPFDDSTAALMLPGERLVRAEVLPVTHAQVLAKAARLAAQLEASGNHLRVRFLTPVRLTQGEGKWGEPDFFTLCKQTARRLLDLCAQHGEGRPTVDGRPIMLKSDLFPAANTVTLVEDGTRWWDVKGYSKRIEREQLLGGLIGDVIYHAPDWRPLLPWLLWGMSTQVGKNVVKGCGMIQIECIA
ncbi:MAG: CRISPR system precrRNA processing endoribonuclease RAMP protein Cas6 [Caldilineaceae bacterium]|nr:CRISPR system precrRNA processing endoribonuclease RAMP protein Cas6 [Caldilineaceae bacterium]